MNLNLLVSQKVVSLSAGRGRNSFILTSHFYSRFVQILPSKWSASFPQLRERRGAAHVFSRCDVGSRQCTHIIPILTRSHHCSTPTPKSIFFLFKKKNNDLKRRSALELHAVLYCSSKFSDATKSAKIMKCTELKSLPQISTSSVFSEVHQVCPPHVALLMFLGTLTGTPWVELPSCHTQFDTPTRCCKHSFFYLDFFVSVFLISYMLCCQLNACY